MGFLTALKNYESQSVSAIVRSINVNTIPQAVLTGHFINKFKQRSDQVSSAFIDLSSYLANVPHVSIVGLYSATKNFNYYFTRSLKNSYSKVKNLVVQSVLPGSVETQMFQQVKNTLEENYNQKNIKFVSKPIDTVLGSIKCISTGISVTAGSLMHSILLNVGYSILEFTWFIFDLKLCFRNWESR